MPSFPDPPVRCSYVPVLCEQFRVRGSGIWMGCGGCRIGMICVRRVERSVGPRMKSPKPKAHVLAVARGVESKTPEPA